MQFCMLLANPAPVLEPHANWSLGECAQVYHIRTSGRDSQSSCLVCTEIVPITNERAASTECILKTPFHALTDDSNLQMRFQEVLDDFEHDQEDCQSQHSSIANIETKRNEMK